MTGNPDIDAILTSGAILALVPFKAWAIGALGAGFLAWLIDRV